ncbi:MAG: 30S ribosomal protein S11 [Bacilli bacterium]|nr:30S ribosomal protein S11 [Bacilli bacterium]
MAKKINFTEAKIYITASFNNTIITITDKNGNVFITKSPRMLGFKGAKRSTPFAAQEASMEAASQAQKLGIKTVDVIVQGTGSGRESAIRAINAAGLKITSIEDATPIAHNGCRPKKRTRG